LKELILTRNIDLFSVQKAQSAMKWDLLK